MILYKIKHKWHDFPEMSVYWIGANSYTEALAAWRAASEFHKEVGEPSYCERVADLIVAGVKP